MKLILGLISLGLLAAAVAQLLNTLKVSYVPESNFDNLGDTEAISIAPGNIVRLLLWSIIIAAALFALVQAFSR